MHSLCPFTEAQVVHFWDRTTFFPSGCREWRGGQCNGYGSVRINQKHYFAHRVAYMIAHGSIPDGLIVRHKCDNPLCCNVDHLEIGTDKDNSRDMVIRGRRKPPTPKFSNADYLKIRKLWRDGWAQKRLAEKYHARVDTIQAIIWGKRGKAAPVGERVIRHHKTKLSLAVRQEMLQRYLGGETQVALAAEYGMSKNGISLALQKVVARPLEISVHSAA